jgi:hypothetical protein
MTIPTKPTAKKQTLRQRWRKTALHNKLLVIIGIFTFIAAAIYTGTTIVQVMLAEFHRREDRRPEIVNNRPPEFVEPFICDPKTGFHSGNMRTFVKNIGKTTATNLFPMPKIRLYRRKKQVFPFLMICLPSTAL